jgi:hypothetical protein
MLARGALKPIWATEFGWSTTTNGGYLGGVSEATQAAYTTQAFKCLEQDPYVEVAFYYNLRNNYWANNANTWDDQLGLMKTNWAHKPAYDAYKGYSPGTQGCTYIDRATGSALRPPVPPSGQGQPGTTPQQPAPATAPVATKPAPAKVAARRTRTVLRVAPARGTSRSRLRVASSRFHATVTLLGTVLNANRGRVTIELQRRVNGHWRRYLTTSTPVATNSAFRRMMRVGRTGSYRVRAAYRGVTGVTGSSSRFVAFKLYPR